MQVCLEDLNAGAAALVEKQQAKEKNAKTDPAQALTPGNAAAAWVAWRETQRERERERETKREEERRV